MSDASPTLRLLSYNVRSLRDDAGALADVIRRCDPHVALIQEAPRLFRWRAKCAALARHSGMVVVSGGGSAVGNLILSSLGVDVLAQRDIVLSREPGLYPRGAALALLRWRDHQFVVAGLHLDLEPAPLRHVAELDLVLAEFGPSDLPTIIGGDINDTPGSAVWSALQTGRTDAFAAVGDGDGHTFSAANPKRRIDGVFVGPGITVASARVVDDEAVIRASDHRPVLVELQF